MAATVPDYFSTEEKNRNEALSFWSPFKNLKRKLLTNIRHSGECLLEMCAAFVVSYVRCRYLFFRSQLHSEFCILSHGPFCLTERVKKSGGGGGRGGKFLQSSLPFPRTDPPCTSLPVLGLSMSHFPSVFISFSAVQICDFFICSISSRYERIRTCLLLA